VDIVVTVIEIQNSVESFYGIEQCDAVVILASHSCVIGL